MPTLHNISEAEGYHFHFPYTETINLDSTDLYHLPTDTVHSQTVQMLLQRYRVGRTVTAAVVAAFFLLLLSAIVVVMMFLQHLVVLQ